MEDGNVVRTEAILTSLIFDHALRTRVKAEAARRPAAPPAEVTSNDATRCAVDQTSDSPGTASEDGEGSDGGHSKAATTATAATVATSSTATIVPPVGQGKANIPPKDGYRTTETENVEKGGKNLMGKINNLITSDISSITAGRTFLTVGDCRLVQGKNKLADAPHSLCCTTQHSPGDCLSVRYPRLEVR